MSVSEAEFGKAAEKLAEVVRRAVERSVDGEQRVAVAFSGGLDSSILALCAARVTETVACTGYTKGSGESERARRAASLLGVKLVRVEIGPDMMVEGIPRGVLPLEPTLMDRSLWYLYSAAAQLAQDAGAKVMLLGQLADELFGGYAKYSEALGRGGPGTAERMMQDDASLYPSAGRLRDVAACRGKVEGRFPYEDPEVVRLATSMPFGHKIRDGVRKAVLREAGLTLGLPPELASAPKKAAQYSSGIQKLLAGAGF